jgi:hypothetical protein
MQRTPSKVSDLWLFFPQFCRVATGSSRRLATACWSPTPNVRRKSSPIRSASGSATRPPAARHVLAGPDDVLPGRGVARSSSRPGDRSVAATVSPRRSSCSVSSRPKPLEVPVINQVIAILPSVHRVTRTGKLQHRCDAPACHAHQGHRSGGRLGAMAGAASARLSAGKATTVTGKAPILRRDGIPGLL